MWGGGGRYARTCRVLVERHEGKSLGTPSGRCEDDIKMELQEIRWKSVDRINLPQDEETWRTVVSRAMNIWFHKTRELVD